jgi:uncharacterized protein
MAPMGIGGTIILLVLSLVFGRDFIGGSDSPNPSQASGGEVGQVAQTPAEAKEVQFISFVLDTVQATWAQLLPGYHPATLVLFRDATRTGCGVGQSAMGPFYCPADQKVYIDLGFYDELRARFGAPGDFAQAYVLAHELGHHVQHLLGTDTGPSVRLELQADCYAGVWGAAAQREGILERGDFEEGMNAAAAVGDDRIQRATTGQVNAETFTHGSSAQRSAALQRGFTSGNPRAC